MPPTPLRDAGVCVVVGRKTYACIAATQCAWFVWWWVGTYMPASPLRDARGLCGGGSEDIGLHRRTRRQRFVARPVEDVPAVVSGCVCVVGVR